MLDVLHWLPLQQRIMLRIGAMVWRCILGLAPAYLRDICSPTADTRGRSSLRSSEQGFLFVPFASYHHTPGSCILGGWPLCVEWASFVATIAPQHSLLTHSTLASKLVFLAVQGSGALLSSNLEGALYKSP